MRNDAAWTLWLVPKCDSQDWNLHERANLRFPIGLSVPMRTSQAFRR